MTPRVIYGGAGELFAISALAHSADGFAQQWITMPGALALAIIAAAGPARVFLKATAALATKDGTVTWAGKPRTAQSAPGRPVAGQAQQAEQAAGAGQPTASTVAASSPSDGSDPPTGPPIDETGETAVKGRISLRICSKPDRSLRRK